MMETIRGDVHDGPVVEDSQTDGLHVAVDGNSVEHFAYLCARRHSRKP